MQNTNAPKTRALQKYLLLAVFFALMIFILTPRDWEPGGETWGAWANARMLLETGRFPVFSRNVLYVAYLVPFLKLPFPVSIVLEYWITHTFAAVAVYVLLDSRLGRWKSLLLATALLPHLAMVEAGATVAAIGFCCLYLHRLITTARTEWPMLPASLVFAGLCHSAFWPLLGVHVAVSLFVFAATLARRSNVTPVFGGRVRAAAAALLIVFAFAAQVLQSSRFDNNHMMMDPKYSPVSLASAINVGFFQIATWELAEKRYAAPALPYKDWYFETPIMFGSAKSIPAVLTSDPRLFYGIILDHARYLPGVVVYLFSFLFPPLNVVTAAISAFIVLLLSLGAHQLYRSCGIARTGVVLAGGAAILLALTLTAFSTRYMALLMPFYLVLYAFYLSGDGSGKRWSFLTSRLFRALVFAGGCILTFTNAPFAYERSEIVQECASNQTPPTLTQKAAAHACRKAKAAHYQGAAVAHGNGLLARDNGVSPVRAYPEIVKYVTPDSTVLALERSFLTAFTAARFGNIQQIWSLPPYEDKSGDAERYLDGIDVFFVSDDFARPSAAISTQVYLRYMLHVLPYLSRNKSAFTKVRVAHYGEVYVRRRPAARGA